MAKSLFKNLVCENCGTIFGGQFGRARMTCSKECNDIIRNARSGRPKGTPHTKEWKKKMSLRVQGSKNPFYGKIHTPEVVEQISLSLTGKVGCLSRRWIKDRTQVKLDTERGGTLHKQWSIQVKNRDGWKCRIANSDCEEKLESHHILSWKDFPEFRYQINNGIALCHFHHPRVRKEEKRLSPYFQDLVSVSK